MAIYQSRLGCAAVSVRGCTFGPPIRFEVGPESVPRVGFSRLLELAVEVNFAEQLIEPIVERIPLPTAELIRSNPERLLVLLLSLSERHRNPPIQVRSRYRNSGENQHAVRSQNIGARNTMFLKELLKPAHVLSEQA